MLKAGATAPFAGADAQCAPSESLSRSLYGCKGLQALPEVAARVSCQADNLRNKTKRGHIFPNPSCRRRLSCLLLISTHLRHAELVPNQNTPHGLLLQSKTHVVLGTLRRSPEELSSHQRKVYKVDDHLGTAVSGLNSDGRSLVRYMRNETLNHRWAGLFAGVSLLVRGPAVSVCTPRIQWCWVCDGHSIVCSQALRFSVLMCE